jgi:hypothetical protein
MPSGSDCDDADSTITWDIYTDNDSDNVICGLDCDDTDNTLGDIANDADCDGVLTGVDCDDADPMLSFNCACEVPLPLYSSVVAHGAVQADPFEEGTSTRISGYTPASVYAELTTDDAFNFIDGSEFDISDPNANTPSSFLLDDLGHYVAGDASTQIFGSYVGLTLDTNNPNDWYYRISEDREFRHYRGGSLVLSELDNMGNYSVVATYDVQEFLLIVSWGLINSGNATAAMEIQSTLTNLSDSTGNLGVNANAMSMHAYSDDAIIAVNGNTTEGPWANYTAYGSFYAQPLNDGDCDGANDLVECDALDPNIITTIYEDGDCDGALTANDCDDTDPVLRDMTLDGDCDGIPTTDDCNDENPNNIPNCVCAGDFVITDGGVPGDFTIATKIVGQCTTIIGSLTITGPTDPFFDLGGALILIDGYLDISGTTVLESFGGLESLDNVTGDVYIDENLELTNLDMLFGLTTIDGWLDIWNNPKFTNLDGLGNLTNLGDGLTVEDNAYLVDIYGLSNIAETPHMTIKNNDSLTGISFPNLEQMSSFLFLEYNDNLTDLWGFNTLSQVGGSVAIAHNYSLQSLDGLGLVTVGGQLVIYDNPLLSDIAALSTLSSIGTDLIIDSNPLLCESDATDMADALMTGVGGTVTIANNAVCTP